MTELTIDQALQQGIEAHKAGQVQKADRLYTAILKAQPKHPDANHNMGVLAVGVGKVEQALPFFKTALEANPATAQFWLSYIDALLKLDRLAEAKAVLDQAKSKGAKGDGFDKLEQRLDDANRVQSSDETSIETLEANQSTLDIAIQLREAGEFNQAIDLLKDEINQFPEDVEMLALLSHCHLLENQVQEAKLYLDKAMRIAPENASVRWNVVRLMLKEQKTVEALSVARDTIQKFPSDVEGIGVLGSCLRANGEMVESLDVLNRALELSPNYAEALINRGLIRFSQNDKIEALADLKKAHQLKPYIKQIWELLVRLIFEAEQYSDAILLLVNMIRIDPNWEKGLVLLSTCNQKADDSTLLVKSFERVLEIKPGSAAVHVNLGIALKKQNEIKAALDNFKKALAINPDYPFAYYNMGITLQEHGQLEEAIEAYNNALKIEPCNAEAYNNMGIALKKQGKLEKAIESYNKALTIKPDYTFAYNNLGVALQEQGKLEEAIEAYNKALAIKHDYAGAYNNMGNALKGQSKMGDAIKAYHKALDIEPDNAEAVRNLMQSPYGLLNEESINIAERFFETFSSKIKTDSTIDFVKSNLLIHQNKLDLAFDKICEANKKKIIMKSNIDALEKNYNNLEKKLANWQLHLAPQDSEKLIKIFILAPPRSGKSQLEALLSKSQHVKPVSDAIKMQENLKRLTFEELFFLDETQLRQKGFDAITTTNPHTIFQAMDIAEKITNSFFIFINRDEFDVASDIFRTDWISGHEFAYDPYNIFRLIGLYKNASDTFLKNLPKNSISISFEEIITQPRKAVHRVKELCSIPYDLEHLDFKKSNIPVQSLFRKHFEAKFSHLKNSSGLFI